MSLFKGGQLEDLRNSVVARPGGSEGVPSQSIFQIEIDISDGKRSFMMNFNVKATTSHILTDKKGKTLKAFPRPLGTI